MPHRRSSFGSIRKLSSGRYQVRYVAGGRQHTGGHPDGSPRTFATHDEARAWLDLRRTEIHNEAMRREGLGSHALPLTGTTGLAPGRHQAALMFHFYFACADLVSEWARADPEMTMAELVAKLTDQAAIYRTSAGMS